MFKKNDPLVGAVQKIMAENAVRYRVEQKLCEELGIYSKNALPTEHKANYDALLAQRINEALREESNPLDKKFGSNEDADADSKSRGIVQDRTSFSPDGSSNRSQTALKKTDSSGAEKSLKSPDAAGDTTRLTQNNRSVEKSGQTDTSSDITRKTIRPDANDGKGSDSEVSAKSSYETKSVSEAVLHPNQKQLDLAKPKGKLTGADFEALRSKKKPAKMDEAEEGDETREGGAVTDTKGKAVVSPTAPKVEPEKTGPSASDRGALTNKIKSIMKEAKERMELDEKKLTDDEMSKREELAKKMKKGDWKERYGKRGKEVMYATATKMAKKLAEEEKKKVGKRNISFDSIMEEIRRKLGEAKMKEIEEEEDPNKPYQDGAMSQSDKDTAKTQANSMLSSPSPAASPAASPSPAAAAPAQPASTAASDADRAAFRARTGSTVNTGTGQVQASQPASTVASDADRAAFRARTGSTVDSKTGQVQTSQPAGTAASAADRDAFKARTGGATTTASSTATSTTPALNKAPTPVAAGKGEGAVGTSLAASGISKEDRRSQDFVNKTLGAGFKAGSAESNMALQRNAAAKPTSTTSSGISVPKAPVAGAGAASNMSPAGFKASTPAAPAAKPAAAPARDVVAGKEYTGSKSGMQPPAAPPINLKPAAPAPAARPPAPINPGAEARANIGDNSLGGGDTDERAGKPIAPAAKPAAAPAPSGRLGFGPGGKKVAMRESLESAINKVLRG